MKIVKFGNGKHGVRVGNWLFGYKFLSNLRTEFSEDDCILLSCQFDTIEEAKNIIKNNPKKYKVIKIK